jgi:hypothetical protein
MMYAIKMISDGMMYIPSFIKMDSGVLKLLGEINIQGHIHKQQGDLISLLLFLKIMRVG